MMFGVDILFFSRSCAFGTHLFCASIYCLSPSRCCVVDVSRNLTLKMALPPYSYHTFFSLLSLHFINHNFSFGIDISLSC